MGLSKEAVQGNAYPESNTVALVLRKRVNLKVKYKTHEHCVTMRELTENNIDIAWLLDIKISHKGT